MHRRTETQIKTLASPDDPKILAEGAPVRRSTAGKLAGGKSRKKSKKATATTAIGGTFETLDLPGPYSQGPQVSWPGEVPSQRRRKAPRKSQRNFAKPTQSFMNKTLTAGCSPWAAGGLLKFAEPTGENWGPSRTTGKGLHSGSQRIRDQGADPTNQGMGHQFNYLPEKPMEDGKKRGRGRPATGGRSASNGAVAAAQSRASK